MGWECGPGVWESLPFSAVSRCLGRDLRTAATEFSTLFPAKMAVWVEIYDRPLLNSLPFSADFRCLGRDLHPAATEFSTLFGSFPLFG